MNTSFTETQAEALRAALAARAGERGALAGFLFALACSPDPVMPSEWIPVVLGEAHGDFASPEEAQRVMDLMMALHNHINVEVAQRKPALPPGIEVRANPMENFGPQAPLGQWAGGYGAGQLWLEETWEACLRGAPEGATRRSTTRSAASMPRSAFSRIAASPKPGCRRCQALPRCERLRGRHWMCYPWRWPRWPSWGAAWKRRGAAAPVRRHEATRSAGTSPVPAGAGVSTSTAARRGSRSLARLATSGPGLIWMLQ